MFSNERQKTSGYEGMQGGTGKTRMGKNRNQDVFF